MYTFFRIAVGLACVAAVSGVCIVLFAHRTPDLERSVAAVQISKDAEFSEKRKLAEVARTTRCTGSMSESCYNVDFTFIERGPGPRRWAEAYFEWQGTWRLSSITYNPPASVAWQ